MLRIVIYASILTLFIFQTGYSVEPSSREERPEPTTDRQSDWTPSTGFPEQIFIGNVTDSKGNPLENVMVKFFANGRLVQSTRTTASGDFELKIPLNLDADETITIWFLPVTGNMMPKMAILKKSSAADKAGLFSPCADQVKLREQMRLDVRLLQEGEYVSNLKAKGCL
ncbi:MAG: carboxypeptidase-like regulatory domain-containing protein [bacterium]